MVDKTLGQIFALVPATITCYRCFGLDLLLRTLRAIPAGRIIWPKGDEFEQLSDLVVARHLLLQGAFGSVNGLNLPTATSSDECWQNAQYNGWLHGHFTSNVLVFAAQASIKSKIQMPLKSGARTNRSQLPFLDQLVSFRQSAEWGMQAIQGSFGRLCLPFDANDAHGRHNLLETVFRLHQIRVRLVGINQLKNVYEPIWSETKELKQVWGSLHDMFFPDIRKADRVAKFHYIEVDEE
ncbi:hypothetical protein CALVIDRAFT_544824 [Calocera viscosa TUFC12733]|uniref:DDE Tnp4 domain-containing protein n=1 Tax=Calocera viscosa (strain TUFC12733) TaxID=1330018 RepID=A0A167NY65_CALVF|nr:hypothetical protein CALVIDRAFT_544824 [Calocera viscosa TUFC12733]